MEKLAIKTKGKSKPLGYGDQLKAGKGKTYWFDAYEAESGFRYVRITESRPQGETFVRNSLIVSADRLADFEAVLSSMKGKLAAARQ